MLCYRKYHRKGEHHRGSYWGSISNVVGNVSESYATGNISGNGYVGGLIGYYFSGSATTSISVSNCFALGNVAGSSTKSVSLGGLIGDFVGNKNLLKLINCYSSGSVTQGSTSNLGGLVGRALDSLITSCYYDGVASKYIPYKGEDTGKLTSGLKVPSNFTGWDFTNVWNIDEGMSYPYLRNVAKPAGVSEGLPVNDVAGGIGTASDPYIISTKEQLNNVKFDLTGCYRLANNIDLENEEWTPIGGTSTAPFKGTFDGNGHTVSNLKITKPTADYIGLFGYASGAILKNININNVSITGKNYVGGLAGCALGKTVIENCSVTGSGRINAESYAGGLVGSGDGNIANCFSTINTTITGSYAGGLIGTSSASISKCYATGNITGKGNIIGGLIGGSISNVAGNVSESYATGNISGNGYVGGLIGYYFSGSATTSISVSNCFALGNVAGSSTKSVSLGGLVGDFCGNSGNKNLLKLINCYSSGSVTQGSTSNLGGLVGRALNSTVTNCYFDSQKSGLTTPATQARTTAQLMQQATYSGWDFENIWNIKEGSSYAYLRQIYNPLDTGVPTAPGSLQVLSTTTSAISLSWNFSTDDFGIAGYKIYRDGQEVGTTAANQYTDTGLTPGTEYNYVVKAFDNSGNISLPSNQVTAVTAYDVPPQLTIDLPDRVHVKDTLNITTNPVAVGKLPVIWTLQKDGAAVDISTYVTASLNTNGGSIVFKSVGNYTLIASITDLTGKIHSFSDTVVVYSNPPTTPVITMSPASNSVTVDTVVTIDAASTDPDGDSVKYVWDGRIAQQAVYPIGKNTVKVKAVDSTGAESPWAAISFFVLNSTTGGGIVLTGPDSTIVEEGIEGATITEYTFTVPPVDGHSGQDYGRVRGYNKGTGEWEQIELRNTENGITMNGTLPAGKYSKLEFYYYTSHDCMYNKSNITYSVKYNFE